MQIRRFKGRALPEVVSQVRAELGPDAVILHTKSRPRGLLRFLHGSAVEVVAAVDHQAPRAEPEQRPAPPAPPAPPRGDWGVPVAAATPRGDWGVPVTAATPRGDWGVPVAAATPRGDWGVPVAGTPQLQMMAAEVAELRRLLLRFGGARGLPSTLAPLYTWLLESGVDETTAFHVLEDVPTVDATGAAPTIEALTGEVERRVAGMMRVAAAPPTPSRATIALVGPTGAGKTTTLAKLAVRAHLAGHTTQVLSLDGMSPGTPAPLEAIARILGVGHEVATTPAAVRAAIERTPADVRLIDTPGLGRGDEAGIAALAGLLTAARPTEVHFVAAATMKADDALTTLAVFGALWVTRLTFTKLDETSTFGSLLSIAAGSGLPVAYLAAGRDVPDDLQPATAWDLSRRVVRRERS